MNVFFGIVLLFFLFFVIVNWYKKDGVLFFCDFSRLAFIIWTLSLGLYDLALSELYHPSVLINVIGCLIILNFYVLSRLVPFKSKEIVNIYTSISKPNSNYKICVFASLFLGVISFLVNLKNGQLRFFMSNTAARVDIQLSYFLNLMVAVSLFFYIMARVSTKLSTKILYFIAAAFALFLIFCNMSRGPLLFWGVGVIIFEIVRYVHRKKRNKLSIKTWILLFILLALGIWAFGAIGNFRTNSIFTDGATKHYRMPEGTPSGLTWVYIYLTSPLENARYILEEIDVQNYANFNNLFYPIIKLLANIGGAGDEYAMYMESFTDVYPYLWNGVGLNVSTFMADAYADFSYAGIFIYVLFYDLIALLVNKIIKSKNISNLGKAIIFPIIIEIAIWSVFDNSVIRIAAIWFDVAFVLLWEIVGRIKIRLSNKSLVR